MQTSVNWFFTMMFLISMIGYMVAAVLFFVSSRYSLPSRLLALCLASFCTVVLNMSLAYTDFFLHFPGMWRVMSFSSFCIAPFAYLYVRSVMEQSIRLRRSDWLLVLPALLYVANLVPFFLTPSSEKLGIVSQILADRALILKETEGLLPKGWAILARVLYSAFLVVLQFKLILGSRKKIMEGSGNSVRNAETLLWLVHFSLVLSVFYFLVFVEVIFHVSSNHDLHALTMLTLSFTILFICLYLLAKPYILYGLRGWLQETEPAVTVAAVPIAVNPPAEPKRLTLSPEQGRAYKAALEDHFSKNHPFRKPGYTLGNLSEELRIPAHLLSAFINQEYGRNFNELVNDHRVGYLEEMVRTSADSHQYTLEALGKMAGFNSRTAFIAAVKKKTGKTPSEVFTRKGEMSPE